MKRGLFVSSIVAGVLSLLFVVMAAERTMAVSSTSSAIETINQGLDWDGVTPISEEKQADRLMANLEVLRTEQSQRNTHGGLALLMIVAAGTAFGVMRRQ